MRTSDNAVLIGKENMYEEDSITSYDRCIYNGLMLHGARYNRAKKSENSYILTGDRIARIIYFFQIDISTFVECQILDINNCDNINHIKKIVGTEIHSFCIGTNK